jgi:hypothetical protein
MLNSSYRKIALTQDKVVIVDESDYDWLNQWSWMAKIDDSTGSFYAVRSPYDGQGNKLPEIRMHRLILGLGPRDGRKGDHKNHNTLDCRRSNLRIADNFQSTRNRRTFRNNTSGYKGVQWRKDRRKWVCVIGFDGKFERRSFATKEEAHVYRVEVVKKYHREFGVAI